MTVAIGDKYGRLTVVEAADPKTYPCGRTHRMWKCRCDCGTYSVVDEWNLKTGHTTSCGCYIRELTGKVASVVNRKHGGASGGKQERLYKVWAHMIGRCYEKNNPRYKDWGGRGITVCPEWRNDYAMFREWALAAGYDETAKRGVCTIDRIDNDKGYSPDNCRWVSMKEQAKNRRPRKKREVMPHPRENS